LLEDAFIYFFKKVQSNLSNISHNSLLVRQ